MSAFDPMSEEDRKTELRLIKGHSEAVEAYRAAPRPAWGAPDPVRDQMIKNEARLTSFYRALEPEDSDETQDVEEDDEGATEGEMIVEIAEDEAPSAPTAAPVDEPEDDPDEIWRRDGL